jgi:hypothetical protein
LLAVCWQGREALTKGEGALRYDGKSRVNVINGLIACSRAATKSGYSGATIAPKETSGRKEGEAFKHQLAGADAGISRMSMGA